MASEMTLKEKAVAVLAYMYGGVHHIPGSIKDKGLLVEAIVPGGLATYDFDQLTRLVLAAHRFCVRVSVAYGAPGRKIVLYFHARKRVGGITEKHPTLQDLRKSIDTILEGGNG